MEPQEFCGNCPSNVNKDAKYSIKRDKGNFIVALVYIAEEGEQWHASTEKHPELVDMVNKVKTEMTGNPGGSFYINEHKQVIVPVTENGKYYLAGKYKNPLSFEFEGKVLSGKAVDLNGTPIQPGADWVGPHPGIPYVLEAGARDIRYEYSPRPNVMKKIKLSRKIGPQAARKVAQKISAHKGHDGGRFYVNEFGNIFAPMQDGWETKYIYIGKIELNNWFQEVTS